MAPMIRAHFDGKVIVPDEPVDLPVGQPLTVELHADGDGERPQPPLSVAERLRRVDAAAGRLSAPAPAPESLRRENLYEERP
ncbi:MAG: hypothetical protein HY321_05320 [Armatimonadetes bacterium]|nr:hypothetical protein [Armatimonadota bacterium]